MDNLRKYGNAPYKLAVIHGGPGAAGGVASLARELGNKHGVLEPLQTQHSISAQIQGLREGLEIHGDLPITLVGWSWGAWLGYMLTAKYPFLVQKLILIGSGPFEAKYAKQIAETRTSRLSERDQVELHASMEQLNDPTAPNKQALLESVGRLSDKADSYDPVDKRPDTVNVRQDIYQSVWSEAADLRRSGRLLEFAKDIPCPVVAIHGDYDPHPAEGVREPLSNRIKDFRFVLLPHCGHKPWIEKQARDAFYRILETELAVPGT
jgi:pimeloyl-ACP methyl ester carboxylesterase